MEKSDIGVRVIEIIFDVTGIELSMTEIHQKFSQIGADSMNKIEVVFAFEEEWGISIPDEKILDVDCTIAEIIKTVEDLVFPEVVIA